MSTPQALQMCRQRVEDRVENSQEMLKAMGVPKEIYQRVVLNALILAPEIADCTSQSLDAAIMKSINARLLPDGKEAAIVPFNSDAGKIATLIPMIDGQVKLAHMANPGLSLRAKVVYRDDIWEYAEGLYPRLDHTPSEVGSRADADVIAAYAIAKLPGGADPMFEVMWRVDIDRHKAFSRSRKRSSWDSHYPEMALKTVQKKLLRRLRQPSVFSPADYPNRDTESIEMEGYDGFENDDDHETIDLTAQAEERAPEQYSEPQAEQQSEPAQSADDGQQQSKFNVEAPF